MNAPDEQPRRTQPPVNGIRLHAVGAGPAEGAPAVLLHGLPEFWYGRMHQIRPLTDAGFRVVVPDQRGHAGRSRPGGDRAARNVRKS